MVDDYRQLRGGPERAPPTPNDSVGQHLAPQPAPGFRIASGLPSNLATKFSAHASRTGSSGNGGSTYSSGWAANRRSNESACSTTCAPAGSIGPRVEHARRRLARLRRPNSDARSAGSRAARAERIAPGGPTSTLYFIARTSRSKIGLPAMCHQKWSAPPLGEVRHLDPIGQRLAL